MNQTLREKAETEALLLHPDSACLQALLVDWTMAEYATDSLSLPCRDRMQAERRAIAAREEYRRVEALPVCWAGWKSEHGK
jgi:hypothetical protein